MTSMIVTRSAFAGVIALAMTLGSPASAQDVLTSNAVTGAGSTFAYPVLSRWAHGYKRWVAGGGDFPMAGAGLEDAPTAPAIDYEPIGSLAGTMRVKEAAVDFGASDVPLSSGELAKLSLGQFPIVIGGVVAVVNIEGVGPGQIRFTGPVLADIFLGKIQTWSDPAIKALNPDLKLPDARIAVVRRADGSGTTYNFTNYLSKVSPQWKDTVGSDLIVKWPTGTGARGTAGVAQAVQQTANAIGYVEFANAVQRKLSYGLIQNKAGKFVMPESKSFQAAADNADWANAKDFDLMLTDAPGEAAYPVVATVFVLMNKDASQNRTRGAFNFFTWALDKGAGDAAQLGYVPLPESLVKQVKAYWVQNYKAGS